MCRIQVRSGPSAEKHVGFARKTPTARFERRLRQRRLSQLRVDSDANAAMMASVGASERALVLGLLFTAGFGYDATFTSL